MGSGNSTMLAEIANQQLEAAALAASRATTPTVAMDGETAVNNFTDVLQRLEEEVSDHRSTHSPQYTLCVTAFSHSLLSTLSCVF
jgi:hypothetical protein